jgi:hypothetical protein
MGAILDLIGSFIVGGLLLLMILSVNNNATMFSIQNGQQLSAQENLVELAGEVDYDFRKIGYHVPIHSAAILSCDSTSLSFLADIDDNGSIDTVTYSLGSPTLVYGTENPRDRRLTRQVGPSLIQNSLGLTDFKLKFYNAAGAQTWTCSVVKSVEITLAVESPFAVDGAYAQSTWKTRIFPRNLQ